MELTILTCTGDRPEQFRHCEAYMARQTFRAARWIVVDDGRSPTTITARQHLIRRSPSDTVAASFCGNLLAGLQAVETEAVAIVEDDDWYAPGWLEACTRGLRTADLFGEQRARYYNLRDNRWHVYGNSNRASLCATALRADCIPELVKYLERKSGTTADIALWRSPIGRKMCVATAMVVGLKGHLTGRPGAASGHRFHGDWSHDPERRILRAWIGDDAARYAVHSVE